MKNATKRNNFQSPVNTLQNKTEQHKALSLGEGWERHSFSAYGEGAEVPLSVHYHKKHQFSKFWQTMGYYPIFDTLFLYHIVHP